MNAPFYVKPIEILLVEDNPGDVRLTQEALADAKVRNNLHVVPNGAEAIRFLRNRDQYADRPRPDLVLLDLNLPIMSGMDVLYEIKNDPDLKVIPVVILTTSQAEKDIIQAYNLNANCYVTKPLDLDRFIEVVKSIEDFWFTIVQLPRAEGTKA
jgi:CheY-like chemotaxis protein